MSLEHIIEMMKEAAIKAGKHINVASSKDISYSFSEKLPSEMKASLDFEANKLISEHLSVIGIPILSEEIDGNHYQSIDGLCFIIDPLDGTFNHVRGLGESAVSIALMENGEPLVGAIYLNNERKLYWGGKSFGSFQGNQRLSVSSVGAVTQAVLCTGFPVRMNKNDPEVFANIIDQMKFFGKVRMFGSAATSLVHVAKGTAEKYAESNIMVWDVAAGIALVEGAGGIVKISQTAISNCLDVNAFNGCEF